MLLELNIKDFAIIERLQVRLSEGFNVLTGETGAGKSIIIDALGMLRGDRPDPTFVRAGAERARVEGIFSIADRPDVAPLLESYGLLDEADEPVIITRELSATSGRSVARINGRAVNSSILREVGGRMVDIHGQHEGLSLFNARTHIDMLDRFGGLLALREQVAAQVAEFRRVQDDLSNLRKAAARRAERIEELRFLLEDVQAAKLRSDEEQELLQERALVQNSAKITDLVTTSYAALYGGSDESGPRAARAILEAMSAVNEALAELARLDPSAAPVAGQSSDLFYTLEDLAANVRSYRDAMEFDTGRLDTIEDRLTLIRDVQRKYRATIPEILERAANAEAEIDRLTHSDEHMAALDSQLEQRRGTIGTLASELSLRRRATGDRLATEIESAMRDLAMKHTRFFVQVAQSDDPQGAPFGEGQPPTTDTSTNGTSNGRRSSVVGRRVSFDKTGVDQVEFLLSPNPGEPLKPLARIASGGESARLLLALKSILSRVDDVPTLVFDEVDVGVGGRAGHVVGEKLWGVSAQHQVLCITHLAQVAAFADAHYAIAKVVSADRTRTSVQPLAAEQRPDELAAMLDGTPISEHSRRSAETMLERAQVFKAKQKLLDQTVRI